MLTSLISIAAAATESYQAAVAGRTIHVKGFIVAPDIAGTQGTVTFKSHTTAKSPAMPVPFMHIPAGSNEMALLKLTVGEAGNITATVACKALVYYELL